MSRLYSFRVLFPALGLFTAALATEEPQLAKRWRYLQQNLQVTKSMRKLEDKVGQSVPTIQHK